MNAGFEGAGAPYKNAGNAWGGVYDNRVGLLDQQNQQARQGFGAAAERLGSLTGTYGKDIMGGLGTLGTAGLAFLSDEDAKEDKREVRGVLDALKEMPVEAWKYKDGEGPDREQHVGVYAQDFQKATGIGDGKSINVIDALGVTMGAVKELAEKVDGIKAGARPKPKSIMRWAA